MAIARDGKWFEGLGVKGLFAVLIDQEQLLSPASMKKKAVCDQTRLGQSLEEGQVLRAEDFRRNKFATHSVLI